MSFVGKEFEYESNEGVKEFVEKIGKAANIGELNELKRKIKFTKKGDTYTVITTKADGTIKETSFKSGVEFDDNVQGKPSKTTATVDGDTLTMVHKFEKGSMTSKSTFSGDKMTSVVTISGVEGQSIVVFKAV